jgi:hypothetical protein
MLLEEFLSSSVVHIHSRAQGFCSRFTCALDFFVPVEVGLKKITLV